MTIWSKKGEVIADFHLLGSKHTPSYLWNGGALPVLFDAGFTFLEEHYVNDARKILGEKAPEILFLTHMHFDHCGGVSAFKKAFPELEIASSKRGAEIIERPGAVKLIKELNKEAASLAPATGIENPSTKAFEPFKVDRILSHGEKIDLGKGCSVEIIATPGHTRDFLSYYLPEPKILIASEAVGCATSSGEIFVEFVADCEAYLEAMRLLDRLDIEVLCQGHTYVYLGSDAKNYIGRSIFATEKYREWVLRLLEETGADILKVVELVKAKQWEPLPHPKQPIGAYLLNTHARVKHLAAQTR
jgi:glyoxylase-like metal-dependent hydrolase (beta-lactamase superfamily II)